MRRGAPARTSKPKFRIDAANALIADEPAPRDKLALDKFATQRLGKDVIDIEDVDLTRGERQLLKHATWRLGPGDRVGIVGVNGAGKTSVLNLAAGSLQPDVGKVRRGRTVVLRHLTQDVTTRDPEKRVLDAVTDVARVTRMADGRDVSATSMLERFGFTGDKLTTRLGDLSGGERRRFQLLLLLLSEPNVLLLDEPTNDLDIDTLNVVEDFLDQWPGTLIVVSHDRYFLERVTDSIWSLMGDGQIKQLPGGVGQYLEMRRASKSAGASTGADEIVVPGEAGAGEAGAGEDGADQASAADIRAARKTIARIDKQLEKLARQEASLHDQMAAAASDHARLIELNAEQAAISEQRLELESAWLDAASLLD